MAENDQRSYRDPQRWRSEQEAPRPEADDPLAELARLIGQSVPTNKSVRDRKPTTPESSDARRDEIDHAASSPAPEQVFPEPPNARYSAREDEQYLRDLDQDYSESRDEHHEPAVRDNPAPPPRASRFRQEPDFAIEPSRDAGDRGIDQAAYHETADWNDRSSDQHDSQYLDDYEDERHDADDHDCGDEYSEDQNRGRRGGFIFVAAVFALALLGTAGAFAYRTMFGGPALPALPPIIKAEGGPNKIMPSGASSEGATVREADAGNAASRERLVSREERPVDIPPSVTSAAPRTVATVPVFPDPPPMGGPGAVVGYSANPTSNNPTMAAEPPNPAAPAMTTATAPNPAPGTTQVSPLTAAPSGTTAVPATPAASGPKKIRTVTIRTDQSGAPDAGAGSVPARAATQPQGPNAPLSIVPSTAEAPAPAAPPRPRTVATQPAPLNKPPANETASAEPAAPAATGGGYAVQVSSQRSEEEAHSSFRDLQAKYPDVLGGRTPIIRRADLGAKGIFFRAMVGPFASADQATDLCSKLKAAGGNCLVQKN